MSNLSNRIEGIDADIKRHEDYIQNHRDEILEHEKQIDKHNESIDYEEAEIESLETEKETILKEMEEEKVAITESISTSSSTNGNSVVQFDTVQIPEGEMLVSKSSYQATERLLKDKRQEVKNLEDKVKTLQDAIHFIEHQQEPDLQEDHNGIKRPANDDGKYPHISGEHWKACMTRDAYGARLKALGKKVRHWDSDRYELYTSGEWEV